MKTLFEQINDMRRGDSLDVVFPEGFEISYKLYTDNEPKTFICVSMNAYYWDEDDHRCLDKYFYGVKKEDDPFYNWTCKEHALTPESRKKLYNYLSNNYK